MRQRQHEDQGRGADEWVRDRFAELERLAADFGCVPSDERGPGRAFRVDGRRVLRVHPKRRHLALGFPEALRSDVAVLPEHCELSKAPRG